MSLARVYPSPLLPIDIDGPDIRLELAGLYQPSRPDWLRLNLISSVSGSATGVDGTSQGLSSRTDRRILGAIRRLADVVLVGAASIRKEGYLLPRTSPLAIVTASGNLSGHGLPATIEAGKLIVLCPRAAAPEVRTSLAGLVADIVAIPEKNGRLGMPDVVAALRDRGLASIVCEGGPNLATQLLAAGLVDEICLTTSAVVNGGAVPLFGRDEFRERRLDLTQLLVDEASGLYARWSVVRSSSQELITAVQRSES